MLDKDTDAAGDVTPIGHDVSMPPPDEIATAVDRLLATVAPSPTDVEGRVEALEAVVHDLAMRLDNVQMTARAGLAESNRVSRLLDIVAAAIEGSAKNSRT